MALRAIIFDVDGTLAETEEAHRAAFNDTFAEWGLPWEWDRALYGELLKVTGGQERLRHFIETRAPEKGAEMLARIPELHARKTERYGELIASGSVPLRPGVARLIDEARFDGLRVGVATTTSSPNVEALTRAALGRPATDVFDALACGEEVEKKKPAPDLYKLALERLDAYPAEAVAIEDSANGLKSALAAGIQTVITPSAYTAGEDFSNALAVVSHLGEPDLPYAHTAGFGFSSGMVTAEMLKRWVG